MPAGATISDGAAPPKDTPGENTPPFRLSAAAAARIGVLAALEKQPGLMLRVSVSGGGCSGFRYDFAFETEQKADDIVVTEGEARVVIDEVSLALLQGSELDYVEDLAGSYFAVKNPNAASSCGCGSSFSVA